MPMLAFIVWLLATITASAYPAPYTCNRNFFVGPPGGTGVADGAGCGGTGNPCATIAGANGNIALQGGDCVHVAAGTYFMSNTIIMTVGGSQNTAAGYVAYIGAPNHASVLEWTGGYFGLRIETNYIVFDGFDFNGNDSITDAFILIGQRKTPSLWQHHIWIINNLIHDSRGGGIATGGGDYYLFAGNTIYNTMYDSPWGESGIEMYGPQPIAGFTPTLPWDTQYYHIQVLQNTTHDNGCIRENATYSCRFNCPNSTNTDTCLTDGNGIDFDDWINQQDGYPAYPYHGLIAGNLSYNNGGRGLSIDPTTQNADVYNNTTYNNGRTISTNTEAEFMMSGNNNNVVNNIFIATGANVGGRAIQWNSAYGEPDTNDSITYNMTWNGTTGSSGIVLSNCGSCSMSAVTKDQLGVNPLLTNPGADFHPASGSPALGAGTAFPSTTISPEPANVTPDGFTMAASPSNMGAFNVAGSANTLSGPVSLVAGGPAIGTFVADAGFNGGTASGPYSGAIDTSLLSGALPPQAALQYQRFGASFSYVVSSLVPSKPYQVIFYWTEDYPGDAAAGARQVNVAINTVPYISGLDIFAAAGAEHKAISRTVTVPADSTGALTMAFTGGSGVTDTNAKIDAIQVLDIPIAPPLSAAAPATSFYSASRNFYVATTGTDNATCGASGTPCATISGTQNATSIGGTGTALQAGDVVNVLAGTYNLGTGITLTKGGNANNATGYVAYKGAANNASHLTLNSGCVAGIYINASYVILDGLDINAAGCSSVAISSGNWQNVSTQFHHIVIENSLIHGAGCGGIGLIAADYYWILSNTLYGNKGGDCGGPIYIDEPVAIQGFTPSLPWDTQRFHIKVLQNVIFGNGGGGIIIWDNLLNNWTTNPPAPYPYESLIQSNLIFYNERFGIEIAQSCQATVANNTSFGNGRSGTASWSELSCLPCVSTTWQNNIAVAWPDATGVRATNTAILWQGASGYNDTAVSWAANAVYNLSTAANAAYCAPAVNIAGTTNNAGYCTTFKATNPAYSVNPALIKVDNYDFHPIGGSTVLGAGLAPPVGYSPITPDGFAQPAVPHVGALTPAPYYARTQLLTTTR